MITRLVTNNWIITWLLRSRFMFLFCSRSWRGSCRLDSCPIYCSRLASDFYAHRGNDGSARSRQVFETLKLGKRLEEEDRVNAGGERSHGRRGQPLKWDEAQKWNCCHCPHLLHLFSQSVLVHRLAERKGWVTEEFKHKLSACTSTSLKVTPP